MMQFLCFHFYSVSWAWNNTSFGSTSISRSVSSRVKIYVLMIFVNNFYNLSTFIYVNSINLYMLQ